MDQVLAEGSLVRIEALAFLSEDEDGRLAIT